MLEYFPAPSSQPDTRKRETDPKLIRPQQAITESYLQGTENRKLGSACKRIERSSSFNVQSTIHIQIADQS